VRNLGHLRQLESLNLCFNHIPSVDALRPLSLNTALRALHIKGNPIAASHRLVACRPPPHPHTHPHLILILIHHVGLCPY
jgi:hypothetical protein